jgi:DNA (cytosine-5)-methyltransferase 1
MKPRLLDLYCGAGGAAMGYHRAGFDVVGVDIKPQPRYPFEFVQGDALSFLTDTRNDWTDGQFQAIHASPPCQRYSTATGWSGNRLDHPDLLAPTRTALQATGLPWIIENVQSAPMRPDVILCGQMFGLRTYRHRWFELGGWWTLCPMHPQHTVAASTWRRRAWLTGQHVTATTYLAPDMGPAVLGIDWMDGYELPQAIPPAYTQFIGEQLISHLPAPSHPVRPQGEPA